MSKRVSMETHNNNINYDHFFTVTLNPVLYSHNARGQLKASIKQLEKLLTSLCKSYKFVAELTKLSNIHYHGILEFNDDIKDEGQFLFIDILKTLRTPKFTIIFGRSEIETIKCITDCENYIMKDVDKTERIINYKKTLKFDIIYHNQIKKKKIPIKLKTLIRLDNNVDSDTVTYINRLSEDGSTDTEDLFSA